MRSAVIAPEEPMRRIVSADRINASVQPGKHVLLMGFGPMAEPPMVSYRPEGR